MFTPLRVLILEDHESDVELMLYVLRRAGFEPDYEHVETAAEYTARLREDLDIILADFTLPQFNALAALQILQERQLSVPFIVVTGSLSEEAAVACMKHGAADYLLKDRLARLGPAVTQALQARRLRDEKRQAQEQLQRRNRELTLLNRIIAASAAGLEDVAILETACRELALSLDAPHAIAVLFNADKTQAAVVAEHLTEGVSLLGRQISASNQALVDLIRRGVPLAIPDALNDPDLAFVRPLIEMAGVISLLLVPLVVNGEMLGVLALGVPSRDHFSKQAIALVHSVADQLSGALARARLEAERRRWTTAIEQTAEAVIIIDPSGDIVDVNPAFQQITGYSRREAIGQNVRMLSSSQNDADLYAGLLSTVYAGGDWRGRLVNRRKDGTLYTADTSISPTRDESGGVRSFVEVQRDITSELELEQRYLQAQKMEAVGRLAGGVAHDFNNLLTAITGYTELLLTTPDLDGAIYADLGEIQKAAERAAALTRQLLAFSRRQVLQLQILDLNKLVQGTEKMLQRLIGEDIELCTDLDPELGRIYADPGQIEQVIMNLAVNARDAMPDGGQLRLETANLTLAEDEVGEGSDLRPGPYVRLTVSDTGHGMDEKVQEHIFEPFFTTKEAGKGTGLGLATVHGIVKQSDGDIHFDSQPGRGTTFEIYLPRVQAAVQEIVTPASETAPSGHETILLAEDEKVVRDLAQRILMRQGYTVLLADRPGEALRLNTDYQTPIHLLITDVVMPGMGGPDLAARIRADRPEIKVLYISGYSDKAINLQGVTGVGIALLEKPFSPNALANKVREVLSTPAR